MDTSNSNEWKWLGLIALLVCLALGAAYWFLVRPAEESGPSSSADNAPPPSLLEQSDNTEDLFADTKTPQPTVTTEVSPSEASDLERAYQQRDSNSEIVYVQSSTSKTTTTDTIEIPDYENDSVEYVLGDVPSPARITYHPAGTIGHGRAGFRFRGDDPNNGGIFFCSLNTRRFKSAERCTSPQIYENLSEGRYLFRVWQANEYGKLAKPTSYLFFVDKTPPPAPQIYGGPAPVTNDAAPTFYFQAKGDAFCSLNKKYFTQARYCSNPIDAVELSDGKYVFRVWQTDYAGNHSKAAALKFTIDTSQPAPPKITAAPSGLVASGTSPTFEFTGEKGAAFRCTIDKTASYSKDVCSSPFSPAEAPSDGGHTFRVWQIDSAGNKSAPVSAQFEVGSPVVPAGYRQAASLDMIRNVQGYETQTTTGTGTYVVEPQETSEDSNITLHVLAAIELATPADDSDKVAPVTGGTTDANIIFTTSADLRSNLAWAVETTLATDELLGGSSGQRALLQSLDLSGASDSGERNADNEAQSYGTSYSQDVSWGDEAGRYTVTATHTASQTLP